jgi:hypothetical protein
MRLHEEFNIETFSFLEGEGGILEKDYHPIFTVHLAVQLKEYLYSVAAQL